MTDAAFDRNGSIRPYSREAAILAWLALAVYLVLSAVFYKERIILRDGANFMAGMINSDGFFLPLHRYAAYVTQLLPVAGLRIGLPLSKVIFLYSLNVALFYAAVMLLLDRVYRDRRQMLGLAVFMWVLTLDTFFMPVSELPVGIAFVFLLLAHIRYMASAGPVGVKAYLVFAVIILHIVFSHPLVLFALFFLVLFFLLSKDHGPDGRKGKWITAALSATGLLIMLKIALTGGGVYGDISKLSKLENILVNFRGYYLDQDANYYFKKYVFSSHLNGLIALLILNVLLLWKRDLKNLLLLDGCCALFTAIYLITHPEFHVRMNMEVYFLVTAFYFSFYFALLAGSAEPRIIAVLALTAASAIIAVQAGRTCAYRSFFQERHAIMDDVLTQMEGSDVHLAVMPFYSAPMKKIMFIGAEGNESLLLSKLCDPSSARTFVYVLADSIDEAMIGELAPSPGTFLNNQWEAAPLDSYDLDYFKLDDKTHYQAFYPEYK